MQNRGFGIIFKPVGQEEKKKKITAATCDDVRRAQKEMSQVQMEEWAGHYRRTGAKYRTVQKLKAKVLLWAWWDQSRITVQTREFNGSVNAQYGRIFGEKKEILL